MKKSIFSMLLMALLFTVTSTAVGKDHSPPGMSKITKVDEPTQVVSFAFSKEVTNDAFVQVAYKQFTLQDVDVVAVLPSTDEIKTRYVDNGSNSYGNQNYTFKEIKLVPVEYLFAYSKRISCFYNKNSI